MSRLQDVLGARGQPFEVVIVNDGSPDDTWAVLRTLATKHPQLRAIDLLHNHSQAMATMSGISLAQGDLVATMDDDLQHPPEELGKLLDAMEANPDWDAVVGCWRPDQGLRRNIGTRIHQIADRIANGTPKGFRHTGFRLMRRPCADAVVAHQTRSPVVGPLLRKVSSRVHNVEVEHHPRPHGRSGFMVREGAQRVMRNFLHGTAFPRHRLFRGGIPFGDRDTGRIRLRSSRGSSTNSTVGHTRYRRRRRSGFSP